ncbi:hypothetical protein FA13DRAFT_1167406 [Coprinellus micaceus]|uniref:Uncharacterized protein n=1 Tax=Coprinellus micaceus TaxID=71717 RepID=A0A4Y7SU53_COPMI|nr:hypothetical protein FA13DRAFT_1167406 [Coprinellus micaceus]
MRLNPKTMMDNHLAAEHRGSLTDTRGHPPRTADNGHASLINGLPVELLAEIFWDFVRDTSDTLATTKGLAKPDAHKVPPYRKPYGDPIILGTVCKFWRSVALSISGLWSTIYITTNHPHFPQRLPLYLSRCGPEPLTLSLHISRPPPQYRTNIQERLQCLSRYEDLLGSVLSLVPRCRRLYLDLQWEIQNPKPSFYPAHPLILEEFSANFSGTWDTRKVTKFCALLDASPHLKRLRWQGLRGNANSTATHKLLQSISTPSIRDLELCDFHRFDEMLGFLRKCNDLETFSCYAAKPPQPSMALVLYGTNAPPGPPPFTILGHLHTLSLLSISALDHVFGLLILPSLKKLTIDHCWDMESVESQHSTYADIGWDALKSLLERSQCNLRTLEYRRHGEHEEAPSVNESALVRFVESAGAQWLEDLSISAAVGDETLRALTLRPGKAPVCPTLKKVVLGRCKSTDGAWSDMVLSRSREPTRLKSASVVLKGHSESNFTRDLMLVVPGMIVAAEWRG